MKNTEEIRSILRNWLQSKDAIVFTDDIAINEVSDEIVKLLEPPATPSVVGRDPKQFSLETEINGKTFVPILELCYMALSDIYGENAEDNCTEFVEVFNDEDEIGVVTYYFDIRIGFTLSLKENHCEFELSADSNRLNINQWNLFKKLMSWGFLDLYLSQHPVRKVSDEITEAIKFISENPYQDAFVCENCVQFLDHSGEANDNSIEISQEWGKRYDIVIKWLKDGLIPSQNTKTDE